MALAIMPVDDLGLLADLVTWVWGVTRCMRAGLFSDDVVAIRLTSGERSRQELSGTNGEAGADTGLKWAVITLLNTVKCSIDNQQHVATNSSKSIAYR